MPVDRQIDVTAWGEWLEDGLRDSSIERSKRIAITRERGNICVWVNAIGLLPNEVNGSH